MSKDSNIHHPETAYRRIEIGEAAAFPIYGERKHAEDAQPERDANYVRPFTPFLVNDKTPRGANGEAIDPAARAFGVFSRETPAETISDPYQQLLNWAHNLALDPSERDANALPQNLMFVISGPGVGKTHLPKVFSKALGYHHVLIGSGEAGGDIDELVIAHELKGETASDIAQKIDAKLAEPGNALSRRYLVDALRTAGFLRENPDAPDETLRYSLDIDKVLALPENGRERTAAEEKALERNLETLHHAGGKAGIAFKQAASGLGVTKVNGRLLEALLEVKAQYDRSGTAEPVIITLDEFNRFRSFGKKLQNFWEVVGGASSEPVTLVDAAGKSHEFTPEILRYVYVYLTGNDPKKVPGARDLDHSMLDRIGENRIFRLDDFSKQAWQQRLEQQLLGIGIDLHQRAGGGKDAGYWSQNPDDFADHLRTKRTQGLTAAEQARFTPAQETLLREWERVHQGTSQVAGFIKAWADTYESSDHRVELNRMETRPSITPRLLNHLANDIRSLKVAGGSVNENSALLEAGKAEGAPERLEITNLGSKIAGFLRNSVDKAHPDPKSGLRHALYRHLYLNGIISKTDAKRGLGDADLSEMKLTSDTQLVEDLLNINPQQAFSKELRPLQRTIADLLRKQFPELAEHDDDSIISLPQVAAALRTLQQQAQGQEHAEGLPVTDLKRLFTPRFTTQENGGIRVDITQTVVADALLQDKAAGDDTGFAVRSLETDHAVPGTLVTTPELLLGLALPGRHATKLADLLQKAEKTPSSLAEDAMLVLRQRGSLAAQGEGDEAVTQAPRLLPTEHPGGLQTAVLHMTGIRQEGANRRYVPDVLHIIAAPPGEDPSVPSALIIGHTPIDKGLESYLKEKRNIVYVNGEMPNAREIIEQHMEGIVENAREHLRKVDSDAPDLKDSAETGLFRHLQQAFDVPLDLASTAADADFATIRRNAIITTLRNGETIRSHTLPDSVTTRSWEELVSARNPQNAETSAARA